MKVFRLQGVHKVSLELLVLGGSWVVISGVTSPLIWVITVVTLLISPLITTHEPPSRASRRVQGLGAQGLRLTAFGPGMVYESFFMPAKPAKLLTFGGGKRRG